MPLTLWNQLLTGGRVPAGHAFANVIAQYSLFRNTINPNGTLADFGDWMVAGGAARGGVNAFNYPLTANQLNIATLPCNEVALLAQAPQGRFARIFLHQWYRCDVQTELPGCLADVFIVGKLRQNGFVGAALSNEIFACGYAGNPNHPANTLIHVGNGIGQHFGFLDGNGQPTAFFNSFFQDTF